VSADDLPQQVISTRDQGYQRENDRRLTVYQLAVPCELPNPCDDSGDHKRERYQPHFQGTFDGSTSLPKIACWVRRIGVDASEPIPFVIDPR